jgi:hypothetical protein
MVNHCDYELVEFSISSSVKIRKKGLRGIFLYKRLQGCDVITKNVDHRPHKTNVDNGPNLVNHQNRVGSLSFENGLKLLFYRGRGVKKTSPRI